MSDTLVPLTPSQLQDLRAKAEQATRGPWTICLGSGNNVCTGIMHETPEDGVTFVADCLPEYVLRHGMAPDDHRPTMKYIAACSPDVILTLVAMVEQGAKDTERLDWIEAQTNGMNWCARQSTTGRGFRLHNSETRTHHPSARAAIDAALDAAALHPAPQGES